MENSSTSQLDQMAGGGQRGVLVVDIYRINADVTQVVFQADNGEGPAGVLAHNALIEGFVFRIRKARDDEPVRQIILHHAHILLFQFSVIVGVIGDDAVSGFGGYVLNTLQHGRKENAVQIDNNNPYDKGFAVAHAARDGIGDIIQILYGLEHLCAQLIADIAPVIQHIGYRSNGHAGTLCHISNGNCIPAHVNAPHNYMI